MNMVASLSGFGELGRHAKVARQLGSPFVAAVLEAGERQLDRAPLTAALIRTWPGNASRDAVAMRFNAALHALARASTSSRLGTLYRREHDDFDGAIGAALAAEDDFVAHWMTEAPQTNEVGRAAAITAALLVASGKFGLPFELLEIGSSCGLNLNLAHYRYDLGGLSVGDPTSPVQIAPAWFGPPPPDCALDIVSARGVDLNPLSASARSTRDRLLAYVWADEPVRAARLDTALSLAQIHRPDVAPGNAACWLPERLEEPQATGTCRAVFHSLAMQYLGDADRKRVIDAIQNGGTRATSACPLVWIRFEWDAMRHRVELWSTSWPDGETCLLAVGHPYGNTIAWY